MRAAGVALLALLALAGCKRVESDSGRPATSRDFPEAYRPVSTGKGNEFSTEVKRDSLNEAETVMDLADIREGTTIADIGAGEGYYTVRLAERVGKDGRVLAEDIVAEVIDALGQRINREAWDNVSVRLGAPDNPRLPNNSFDRIFLVHMYHEIEEPYAFLWHMRPALKPDGEVIVVDADRPTEQHGTPPRLLRCEFTAVGYQLVSLDQKPTAGGYVARFRIMGGRPRPEEITPCALARD